MIQTKILWEKNIVEDETSAFGRAGPPRPSSGRPGGRIGKKAFLNLLQFNPLFLEPYGLLRWSFIHQTKPKTSNFNPLKYYLNLTTHSKDRTGVEIPVVLRPPCMIWTFFRVLEDHFGEISPIFQFFYFPRWKKWSPQKIKITKSYLDIMGKDRQSSNSLLFLEMRLYRWGKKIICKIQSCLNLWKSCKDRKFTPLLVLTWCTWDASSADEGLVQYEVIGRYSVS